MSSGDASSDVSSEDTSVDRSSEGGSNSKPPENGSLATFLRRGWEESVYPGAVAAVGSTEGITSVATIGERDPEQSAAMTRTTSFDVASLTKPVITATTTLSLAEQGVLALSDELGQYVESVVGRRRGEARLLDLLTHSSGIQPYAFEESWNSLTTVLDGLEERALLDTEPRSRHAYSCLGFVYLSEALRQATGRSLDTLAAEHVFDPAGMDAAVLGPVNDTPELAATYDHEYRGRTLRGEVHDPLGWATDGRSGNAGLFATVDDLAAFAQAHLQGDGTLLSARMTERLREDWLPELGERHSLGWRLAEGTYPAPNWSQDGLGHTGYTGTSLWLDHAQDRFAVLLTNQVYEGKETGLVRFRERFHAVAAAGGFD